MTAHVLKPGMLTTVQDLGRYGAQRYGVVASGAMDAFAARVANVLVGNAAGEAVLEMTIIGAALQFEKDALIAICGGDFQPTIDGAEVPQWRAVLVRTGCTLKFAHAVAGSRCYLAICGGIDVPELMGSRSTYLRANLGGHEGRALQAGDRLKARVAGSGLTERLSRSLGNQPFAAVSPTVYPGLLPHYSQEPLIRITAGRHYELFTEESRDQLLREPFKVTPQSDRMGYRLQGPQLQLTEPLEMISEAVSFGTLQVPPDGNPVALMADRQTTGGYPKIAQIASVDLPVMAQLAAGADIHFELITLEEAESLAFERELHFRKLETGIKMNYIGR